MDIPIIWKAVIIAVASYLLGSVNFAVIFTQMYLHKDIRTLGSGNAGTTNALRTLGVKKTIPVFVGDILKGVLAGLLGLWMGQDGQLIALFFVILGHTFPLYYGFRRGKGILSTAAWIAVFDWRILAVVLLAFIVIVSLSRLVSLGSITAAALVPVMMLILHPSPWWYTLVAVVLCGGIIWLHRGNISRLIAGTEGRSSFHRSPKT